MAETRHGRNQTWPKLDMAETRHEAHRHHPRRSSLADSRDDFLPERDTYLQDSVGRARLSMAVGGCATDLASGCVMVAGGLITDLVSTCLDPVDRIIGAGQPSRRRARAVDENDPHRDYHVSHAIERALSAATDTLVRAEQRYHDVMAESPRPGAKAGDTNA
jgi:hypothetical protein